MLPVTIISSDEIEARNAATPLELMESIPYITDIPENETPTNGIAGRGDNRCILQDDSPHAEPIRPTGSALRLLELFNRVGPVCLGINVDRPLPSKVCNRQGSS